MAAKKTASSGMGCFLKLLLFILLVIVGVMVLTQFFFPGDSIKAKIVNRSTKMLGRPVELDDVSLSLFPSPHLKLSGLRIYNPEDFAGGEFVSIDNLSCGLKIIPLLSLNFEFSEISVDHPVIRLRKAPDGKVNYSFALDTEGKPIQTPTGPKIHVSSGEAAMVAFAIDWAEINHGDIIYTDDSAKYKVTLNNFSLKTKLFLNGDGQHGRSTGTLHIPSISSELIPNKLPLDLNLTYNADIDFLHTDITLTKTRLKINGIAFDVESTIRNFRDPSSIFAKIQAQDVSLEPLTKYIPLSENFNPDDLHFQGTLTGEVETRIEFGTNRTPYVGGRFSFDDLTVTYQSIAGRMHFGSFVIDFDSDSIAFTSSGGTLSGKPLAIGGVVKNWNDLLYDCQIKGVYDISGIAPFLDESLHNELRGSAEFNLKINGKKSDWAHTKILGDLRVDSLYYNNDSLTSPLERLDLMLSFKKNRVNVDSLYAEYPGVKLSLTGTLKNGFAHLIEPRRGYKKPKLEFAIKSPLINYDILLPEEEAKTQVAVSAPKAEAPGATSSASTPKSEANGGKATAPIFIPDIEAEGMIAVDTFVFRDMRFTDLNGRVSYKDGIIDYRDVKGHLYNGNLRADGSVDITDMFQPFVTADFSAEGIEANECMTQFAGVKNHIFGRFNAKGRLAGRGSVPEDFIKSLNAESNIVMNDGRLVNFDLVEKLAEKFSFKTFKEEQIKNLVTDIVIRDGKLLLDGTKVANRLGNWNINGTIAFVDKTLDLKVNLYLSKEYSKSMKMLGDLLADDNGRVRVNFDIIGTYEKPEIAHISTDNKAAKKKIENKIKEEAKGLLNNLFKKK